MRYFLLIITVYILSACTNSLSHKAESDAEVKLPLYIKDKTIENGYTKPLAAWAPRKLTAAWQGVLKRQPVLAKKATPTLESIQNIQKECNNFNWASPDNNWSTPKEAQLKGWGDCKDAAICKYYKLRAAGFSANQLNLWSGWYGKKLQAHLVLAVTLNDKSYILDALSQDTIPAHKYMFKTFHPSHRLNENGWSFD